MIETTALHAQLAEMLRLARLERVAPLVLEMFKPAVGLGVRAGAVLPAFSQFRGMPDVPADFAWPVSRAVRGSSPMTFLAQVNLGEIASIMSTALPPSGMLSFFANERREALASAAEFARAYYFSDVERLKPMNHGFGAPRAATGMQFTPVPTIPYCFSAEYNRLQLTFDEARAYFALEDSLMSLVVPATGFEPHRLLGFPSGISLDGFLINSDTSLVAQFGADQPIGFSWEDIGTAYFTMKSDALRRGDFSAIDATIIE